MISQLDSYYSRLADAEARGPQLYGGDAAVASLTAFRAYHKDARYHVVTHDGQERWYTSKMMRIEAILLRIGTVGTGYTKTREIAAEAGCSPGYVSKMIGRFQAWGVIGTISTRGRYGKLFVFARAAGDKLDHYASWARTKMREAKQRSIARALRRGSNVSSFKKYEEIRIRELLSTSVSREETLDVAWLSPYTRKVVHERARLAIEDPEGEREAVAPLTPDHAQRLFAESFDTGTNAHGTELADALGIDLGKGKGRVPCPAHGEHRDKTLSWSVQAGRLLVHCFAGCTFDEIRRAAFGG